MTATLYVAARAPRPSFAKTRLGQTIGDESAALVYAAFLCDLAARLTRIAVPVGWYVTPADAWDDLAPLVLPHRDGPVDAPGPVRVLVQGDGDWAARQQALFREAPARGETRTVLIASDSPHLALDLITQAFELLASHDLVLGPTFDGGYYLVGMRGPWEVLDGVRMSTDTVFAEIVRRAERQGLSVATLAPTFDVDEAEDLARLAEVAARRHDLPSTRAALARLGWLGTDQRPVPLDVDEGAAS
jgi:rSAM/selenodomain-associated transferase 1